MAILASGGVSHTSDNRISASADESLTDWQLRITDAQPKDSVSGTIGASLTFQVLAAYVTCTEVHYSYAASFADSP